MITRTNAVLLTVLATSLFANVCLGTTFGIPTHNWTVSALGGVYGLATFGGNITVLEMGQFYICVPFNIHVTAAILISAWVVTMIVPIIISALRRNVDLRYYFVNVACTYGAVLFAWVGGRQLLDDILVSHIPLNPIDVFASFLVFFVPDGFYLLIAVLFVAGFWYCQIRKKRAVSLREHKVTEPRVPPYTGPAAPRR